VQTDPVIVSDGAGGAIVAWADARGGDLEIYVRRIDASGTPLWTSDGVALCVAGDMQWRPRIVSDGAGGAIIVWTDHRNLQYDVFARRIDASGNPLWTSDGVPICTASGDQYADAIVADGSGGAILAWTDSRNTFNDIYSQRINAAGNALWTADGVALCAAANGQSGAIIASDGAGGAIVAWEDLRMGDFWPDLYARRIDAAGSPLWTADGVAVCPAAHPQVTPSMVSDGAGGAIFAWSDGRNAANGFDLYAQRVTASGSLLWTTGGTALCNAAWDQSSCTMVSDGASGAVIIWLDRRGGTTFDVYAQRVAASGGVLWTVGGVPVCTVAGEKLRLVSTSAGAGSAIAAWADARNEYPTSIYAQRVEFRFGYWGYVEPAIHSVFDARFDQGSKVEVDWYASQRDAIDERLIGYYSIWRAINPAAATEASSSGVPLVRLSDVTKEFAGPAIREEESPTGDYFWELVGTEAAIYRTAYAFTAPTWYDSTAASPAVHQFQVVAHAYYDQFLNWPSNVVSGYSVDNLAPSAPLLLTAQRVGADVQLKWNRVRVPDLRDYSVYRATSSGVTPVPINFLSASDDTVLVDLSAPTSALYYIVTAYDVHANQSDPSNEASVEALTGVGTTPALAALTVLQNHPNPFNATTDFEIGLPSDGDVSVEVFDVAGRRVSAIDVTGVKGWQRIPFAGRDERGRPLASGVYFYRVNASGETLTRKMVIAR
jgi:hypothetical protein